MQERHGIVGESSEDQNAGQTFQAKETSARTEKTSAHKRTQI
jgi:hypothetical protein